jgi:hypothetical protein
MSVMETLSNALLFGFGFGLIMQRSSIADQASWETCARQLGLPAPDTYTRRGIVLAAGLAFSCTGLLRFFA